MKTKMMIQMMAACFLMATSPTLFPATTHWRYPPLTVEDMPVSDEIGSGETVEIRLEILQEGDFDGTVYTLCYSQPDGDAFEAGGRHNPEAQRPLSA